MAHLSLIRNRVDDAGKNGNDEHNNRFARFEHVSERTGRA
jgi:hypothetical protein